MRHKKSEIPLPFKRGPSGQWVARCRILGRTREQRFDEYQAAQRWILQCLISTARERLMWLESELRDLGL